jgi:hypothetical protein
MRLGRPRVRMVMMMLKRAEVVVKKDLRDVV